MGSTSSDKDNPPVDPTLTDTGDTDDQADNEGLRNNESGEELTPESKEGFHKKLTEKDKLLKQEQSRREEAERELSGLREAERQRKLDSMTETERLQTQLADSEKEKATLKINHFVLQEINRRGLSVNDPLIKFVVRVPWEVEEVRRVLGDSPTWDEVLRAIQDNIPSYLDSLEKETKDKSVQTQSQSESETTAGNGFSTDTERTVTPVRKRTWSQREIGAMDDATYSKHQAEINAAMGEGRIIP